MTSRGRLLAATAVVLALAATTGCVGLGPDQASDVPAGAARPASGADTGVDAGDAREALRETAQRILDRQVKAVRAGDRTRFLAAVDRSDPRLVARQRRLFDNLRQLPLKTLRYEVEDEEWNTSFADDRWGEDAYLPFVVRSLQIRGYDAQPVRERLAPTFAEVDGELRIVADDDVASQSFYDERVAPWDLVATKVVAGDRVLGVFDARSARRSAAVIDAVEAGIDAVADAVPGRWRQKVVVYATSSRRVVQAMDGIPGSDPDGLSAVAFPVFSDNDPDAEDVDLASMRFLLHPALLKRDGMTIGRVVRHELAHVALARRHWRTPVWLREGIAEYVALQGPTPLTWYPHPPVLRRAERGAAELPSSTVFNTIDQEWHYVLALAACEEVVERFGESRLWELLRVMNAGRGTSDEGQDRVLRKVLGVDGAQLAGWAADRIVANRQA